MELNYTMLRKNEYFSDLYLLFCGFSENKPGHSYGPGTREEYIIHCVAKGQGTYRLNGVTYSLHEGQCFMVLPGESVYYEADADNPWAYFWAGFNGTLAPKVLEELGISLEHPVVDTRGVDSLKDTLSSMMVNRQEGLRGEFLIQSAFAMFVSQLMETVIRVDRKVTPQAKQRALFQNGLQFIQEHYADCIKVRDVAAYLSIDRSYLTALFKRHLDTTPQKYLNSYRIAKAVDLLLNTDYSIDRIARMVGFGDPFIFSKAFKREKSLSPSAFRTNLRGEFEGSMSEFKKKIEEKQQIDM